MVYAVTECGWMAGYGVCIVVFRNCVTTCLFSFNIILFFFQNKKNFSYLPIHSIHTVPFIPPDPKALSNFTKIGINTDTIDVTTCNFHLVFSLLYWGFIFPAAVFPLHHHVTVEIVVCLTACMCLCVGCI